MLDTILKHKNAEIALIKGRISLQEQVRQAECMPPARSLYKAIKEKAGVSLIAEVKKASPSKGIIRADFDPVEIAKIYTANGAAAISVLTDERFFHGSPEYLEAIRQSTELPLLRKDFIIDPCQIYQARCLGADAILLIAAILDDQKLSAYLHLARQLGMECLVEVHTGEELSRVLKTKARIIGINNRNLNTFKTDIDTTFALKEMIGSGEYAIVSESGINTPADVWKLKTGGVDAMLVGEALVRELDIAGKVKELLEAAE